MPDDPRAALRAALFEFHAEMPGACVEDAANAGVVLAEAVRAYLEATSRCSQRSPSVLRTLRVRCPRCGDVRSVAVTPIQLIPYCGRCVDGDGSSPPMYEFARADPQEPT